MVVAVVEHMVMAFQIRLLVHTDQVVVVEVPDGLDQQAQVDKEPTVALVLTQGVVAVVAKPVVVVQQTMGLAVADQVHTVLGYWPQAMDHPMLQVLILLSVVELRILVVVEVVHGGQVVDQVLQAESVAVDRVLGTMVAFPRALLTQVAVVVQLAQKMLELLANPVDLD
jgi:hypothetical protein